MSYIDGLADVLSRIICQYLNSREQRLMDDCVQNDEDSFSGTLSEYEQYLEEHHFNQEDDCPVEEVDELDFSA